MCHIGSWLLNNQARPWSFCTIIKLDLGHSVLHSTEWPWQNVESRKNQKPEKITVRRYTRKVLGTCGIVFGFRYDRNTAIKRIVFGNKVDKSGIEYPLVQKRAEQIKNWELSCGYNQGYIYSPLLIFWLNFFLTFYPFYLETNVIPHFDQDDKYNQKTDGRI